jgi:hypothetical protein
MQDFDPFHGAPSGQERVVLQAAAWVETENICQQAVLVILSYQFTGSGL